MVSFSVSLAVKLKILSVRQLFDSTLKCASKMWISRRLCLFTVSFICSLEELRMSSVLCSLKLLVCTIAIDCFKATGKL
jgi:hypothetical protein